VKSRSLTFVDPFGNATTHKYMDHELLSAVFRKHKKKYIPKYLQQWIKLGRMNGSAISALSDCEMKSTVSEYGDNSHFVTYGEVTVWEGEGERFSSRPVALPVRLTNNMEKTKVQSKKRPRVTNIELKSLILRQNTSPSQGSWSEGQMLQDDDTIVSSQLYQKTLSSWQNSSKKW
jgi:hypothetical protein